MKLNLPGANMSSESLPVSCGRGRGAGKRPGFRAGLSLCPEPGARPGHGGVRVRGRAGGTFKLSPLADQPELDGDSDSESRRGFRD